MTNIDTLVNDSDYDATIASGDVPRLFSFDVRTDSAPELSRIVQSPEIGIAGIVRHHFLVAHEVWFGVDHIGASTQRFNRSRGVFRCHSREAQAGDNLRSL